MTRAARTKIGRILAETHIGAVAIAFLLFWSIESGYFALYFLFSVPVMNFWGSMDVSFFFSSFSYAFQAFLSSLAREFPNEVVLNSVFNAVVCLAGATVLSRLVYGVGPVRSLSTYRVLLARRTHE